MPRKIYDIRRAVDVTCPKCGESQRATERSVHDCVKCGQAIAVMGHRRPPKENPQDKMSKETSIERKLRLEREGQEKRGRAMIEYERNKEETRTASGSCN